MANIEVRADTGGAVALLMEHARLQRIPAGPERQEEVLALSKLLAEGTSVYNLLSGMIVVAKTMLDILENDYGYEHGLREIGEAAAIIEAGLE